MVYIILNVVLLACIIYFAHYLDTKVKRENFEISSFAVSMLFVGIETVFFIFTLIFSQIWLDSITTHSMRIVFVFDAVFFTQISFSFISLVSKKKKGVKRFVKILLIMFAVYIVYFHFTAIETTIQKGVIVESEYLFGIHSDKQTAETIRQFFPWTWFSLYNAVYRYIMPTLGYISLLLLQEDKATQIERYQANLLGLGILIMWISSFAIRFIAQVSPSFSLLFLYPYLFMIMTLFAAWTKTSVPSGKAILVIILRTILSIIIPAIVLGGFVYLIQPRYTNFTPLFIVLFSIVSLVLISYSLGISELLSNSSKFYTSDYEKGLEKDLAKIDYKNGELEDIANRTYEIFKKHIETSSMNVYILSSQAELETAYSSNKTDFKFSVADPMFDTLLNVNRSVVVYSEIEKEHDLSAVHDELEKFFEYTKSDCLFILNEGHNIFGLITFGKKISGDHYKVNDRMIFEKLYSYFFVFGYFMRNISNKDVIGVVNREIKMSSQIITSIQENIDRIGTDKCDVGYLMTPAHNIGGEFIDFIRLTDTRHLIVVGDLSGKGIAASMNMVILKSIIRTYLAETHDFKDLVVKVNRFIRDSLPKGTIFAGTFALLDFESDTLYYINCGIPALMLYTQVYNNVIEIQGSGHILGFVKDISPYISVKSTKLNPGDIIVACTDGLIQSHSLRGEMFGKERVQQAILDNSTYPAQRMAQFTFDGLLKFMSKEMEDDVSILVLKYGHPEDIVEQEKSEEETEAVEEVVEEKPETPAEEIPAEKSAESVIVEEPDLDTFEVTSEDEIDVQKTVEEKVAAESEAPKEEKKEDMALPEGFEMPDLSDLDSLLSEAGL